MSHLPRKPPFNFLLGFMLLFLVLLCGDSTENHNHFLKSLTPLINYRNNILTSKILISGTYIRKLTPYSSRYYTAVLP